MTEKRAQHLKRAAVAASMLAASCSGDCVCEPPGRSARWRSDDVPETSDAEPHGRPASKETIEAALWPKPRPPRYVAADEARCAAVFDLVHRVSAAASNTSSSVSFDRDAREAGLRIEQWLVGPHRYLALLELAGTRGMMGAYVFRMGPTTEGREIVLQAPHSFFDVGTGEIALETFLRAGEQARALFVNTLHRHMQADGRKEHLAYDPADVAHNRDHPFSRATQGIALAYEDLLVVQIHGFGQSREIEGVPAAEVVTSSGDPEQSGAHALRVQQELQNRLDVAVARFPEDTRSLGATTNMQKAALEGYPGADFLHLELSKDLRSRLRADSGLLDAFVAGLLAAASPPAGTTP